MGESPSPLDCLHEIPHKLDANLVNILGRVFGDKSMGANPKIIDLIREPFFNATNVPRADVSLFVALKEENEMVRSMIDDVLQKCYATYSNEELLSGKASVSTKKKKKKKKRRKVQKTEEKVVENIEMEKKETIVVVEQVDVNKDAKDEDPSVKVEQEERES